MKMEVLGKNIRIARSQNPSQVGICGLVIDETRNTIVLRSPTGIKRVLKGGLVLETDGRRVQGSSLAGRVHERLKR